MALFGTHLNKAKRDLILKLNCNEVIIALDRQYEKVYEIERDSENKLVMTKEFEIYKKWVNKIAEQFKGLCRVYVMFDNDKNRLLEYKQSPSDCGKEVWDKLYEKRIELN